ncbi:MAG TPA: methyltransferase domain-containing protein [Solirubrobacteraceae bacterium]|nr:methyltransferase domain-containing protein [Solirubrobacteraceae bacterium]
MSDARTAETGRAEVVSRTPAQVVWHDLECGTYRADLSVWRELARQADGPILDVGAGSGRVAIALAREGHAVTAIDREQPLLDALRARAAALPIETVCADARELSLARADYALCLMPMQTIQLLGGSRERKAFLRSARLHVRAGGLVACAILGELEPFDCSQSEVGPAPEQASVDGLLYVSRALRVAESRTHVVIERDRRIFDLAPSDPLSGERSSGVEISRERDKIELDRVSASTIEREARAVGLSPQPRLQIAATDEHVGSVVVVLRV